MLLSRRVGVFAVGLKRNPLLSRIGIFAKGYIDDEVFCGVQFR